MKTKSYYQRELTEIKISGELYGQPYNRRGERDNAPFETVMLRSDELREQLSKQGYHLIALECPVGGVDKSAAEVRVNDED